MLQGAVRPDDVFDPRVRALRRRRVAGLLWSGGLMATAGWLFIDAATGLLH